MSTGWGDDIAYLLSRGLVLAVIGLVLSLIYKTLDHPRLPVVRTEERPPTVTARGLVLYLVSTPIMVIFWFCVLWFVVAGAAGERLSPADQVGTAVMVVFATRLLAHVNHDASHELGKMVPIAMVGLLLLDGVLQQPEVHVIIDPADLNGEDWRAPVLLLGAEFVIAALWFVAIRARWHLARRWHAQPGQRRLRWRLLRLRGRQLLSTGQTPREAQATGTVVPQPGADE